MIDTIEKAKAYGRLIDTLHLVATNAIDMDEAAIEDLARRVEVVADSIVSAEYMLGDRVQVRGLPRDDFPWFDGTVTEFRNGEVVVTETARRRIGPNDPELACGKWHRAPGDPTLRKVSR